MRRREYLVAAGTATTITSGTGLVSDTAAAQEDSQQESPIAQSGQFELVAMDAPDEVEVMTPFTLSYTVANTSDEDATFWTYFTLDAWGESGVRDRRHGVTVPANSEVTIEDNTAHAPYLGTLRYYIQSFDHSFSIDAVPASNTLGEEWRSPDDLAITVEDVVFRETYEYEGYDGSMREQPSSEGSQWAFVWVRAENVGNESQYVPTGITLISDGQQYDRAFVSKEEGRYETGSIEPGIVRQGWIAYEIPADLSPRDVMVSHTDSGFVGEWTARWSVGTTEAENDNTSEPTETAAVNAE